MSKVLQSKYSTLRDEEYDGSLDGLMKPDSPVLYCPHHESQYTALWKYLSYSIVGCLSALGSFMILLHFQPLGYQDTHAIGPVPACM